MSLTVAKDSSILWMRLIFTVDSFTDVMHMIEHHVLSRSSINEVLIVIPTVENVMWAGAVVCSRIYGGLPHIR